MKKVEFYPKTKEIELLVPHPKPSRLYIPQWYKDIPFFENKEFKVNERGQANLTLKSCVPFLDSYNMGYIQETWCDIIIEREKITNNIIYRYSMKPEIMNHRGIKNYFQISDAFDPVEFIWHQPWIPKLPKGYSMLYTHPLNRYDLPFLSLTGVIDNDVYFTEAGANYPFYLKKDFIGIIPAGTPMLQMIPIKRDNWVSDKKEVNSDLKTMAFITLSKFYGYYKKHFWQKKNYK